MDKKKESEFEISIKKTERLIEETYERFIDCEPCSEIDSSRLDWTLENYYVAIIAESCRQIDILASDESNSNDNIEYISGIVNNAVIYAEEFTDYSFEDSGIQIVYDLSCALSPDNICDIESVIDVCFIDQYNNSEKRIISIQTFLLFLKVYDYFALLFEIDMAKAAIKWLLDHKENIEPEIFGEYEEGALLYLFLQFDMKNLSPYEEYVRRYLELAEKNAQKPSEYLDLNTAYSIMGNMYAEKRDHITAEDYYRKAIRNAKYDSQESYLSDVQIRINLLQNYLVENYTCNISTEFSRIYEIIDNNPQYEIPFLEYLRLTSLLVLFYKQEEIDFNDDEENELDELYSQTCDWIFNKKYNDKIQLNYLITYIMTYSDHFYYLCFLNKKKKTDCYNVRNRLCLLINDKKYNLSSIQSAIILYLISELSYYLNEIDYDVVIESINTMERSGIKGNPLSSHYISCALMLSLSEKETENLIIIMKKLLQSITRQWKDSVLYGNDYRLINHLTPANDYFLMGYAVLRKRFSVESAYNWILYLKDLPSLAARERNRNLRMCDNDEDMLISIREQQNRIARLETSVLHGFMERVPEEEYEKLRIEEKKFSECFPQKRSFMNISIQAVFDSMPKNGLIVEFMFYASEYDIHILDENKDYTSLDIYLLKKEDRKAYINRITVQDGGELSYIITEYITILRAEASGRLSPAQIHRESFCKEFIYEKLIYPLKKYCYNASVVYLALDTFLTNLAIENMIEEIMPDKTNVLKIECGRDLLYFNDNVSVATGGFSDSLVMGNPRYEIDSNINDSGGLNNDDGTRSGECSETVLTALPLSQIEAGIVSELLTCPVFTGKEAVKDRLLRTGRGVRVIHIATHGSYDEENENVSLFSSLLYFSGAIDWLRDGIERDIYGNGLVMADEISKLNLQDTELVTLSACTSGINELACNKAFLGLIDAFSSAGVRFVIATLWTINDLSAVLFFEHFYYEYIHNHESPPVALSKTKKWIRNLTAGEIRKKAWIKDALNINEVRTVNQLNRIFALRNDNCPFEKEAYWGGYVCYRCN